MHQVIVGRSKLCWIVKPTLGRGSCIFVEAKQGDTWRRLDLGVGKLGTNVDGIPTLGLRQVLRSLKRSEAKALRSLIAWSVGRFTEPSKPKPASDRLTAFDSKATKAYWLACGEGEEVALLLTNKERRSLEREVAFEARRNKVARQVKDFGILGYPDPDETRSLI